MSRGSGGRRGSAGWIKIIDRSGAGAAGGRVAGASRLTVVVAGERVPGVAQAALPPFLVEVDVTVRVQHAAALGAHHGRVGQHGHPVHRLHRGAYRPEWQHHPGRLDPGGGPGVPRQADALLPLQLREVHRARVGTRRGTVARGGGVRDGSTDESTETPAARRFTGARGEKSILTGCPGGA